MRKLTRGAIITLRAAAAITFAALAFGSAIDTALRDSSMTAYH
jgi:hypothetical protein